MADAVLTAFREKKDEAISVLHGDFELGNFNLGSRRVGYYILGPFANYLSRVYSFRKVCLLGGVVILIGYLSTVFVQQMELMYLTFGIIAGGGYGLAYAPCSTLVNFYFGKRRAFANGIVVAASGTGAFLLPYLYRYVDEYGLQGGILILSAVKMNTCVFAFLFRQPAALCKTDEAKIKELNEVTLEKELQGTDIMNDSRNNSNSLDPLSVGLEKLSAGFGIVSLCMGIGVGIAQPFVGWLEDATGNWDMSFRFAGMLKLLAGIVFLCEPLIVSFFREKPMPDEKHIPGGIELDIEIGAEIGEDK
ncbi:hypothetical protein ScPMuIL_001408 [Solemya velum]